MFPTSPAPKRLSQRGGFTLVEMLVACTVLTIILSMLFQMLGMMSKTWIAGQAKAENSVKARAMLDLMCQDIGASVSRPDLPAFRDASGGSALAFYTRRQGIAAQADPTSIRPLSLVSYDYVEADSSLVRHDLPLLWTSPGPFQNNGQITNAGALAGQPAREISPGIVAFSLAFLSGDQNISQDYLPPSPSDPYYNLHGVTYDATKVSRAVVVSIAVIDARTLDLLKSTGSLPTLRSALSRFTAGNSSLLTAWQKDIADGKLGQSGLPRAAAANLLVLERFIPLPAQPATL